MTTKTITIAGKEVTLAYCYATEIGYHKYTGESINNFDKDNPEHLLYLTISSILAWSQSKGVEPVIKAEELMYEAKYSELLAAVKEIFILRAEWYEIPLGEPTNEGGEGEEKND